MALKKSTKVIPTAVEVISKHDDALDLEQSNFEEYEATGDINHLVFIENKQPTRFICNFNLKAKEKQEIMNISQEISDSGRRQVNIGSLIYTITRFCLKDIQYPESVADADKFLFKKDKDGYVTLESVAELDNVDVPAQIAGFYNSLTKQTAKPHAKN